MNKLWKTGRNLLLYCVLMARLSSIENPSLLSTPDLLVFRETICETSVNRCFLTTAPFGA